MVKKKNTAECIMRQKRARDESAAVPDDICPKRIKRSCDEEDIRLGIIEKVTLKNFMCHSNLEFNFGTDIGVHFITGRNGSGKSAVLNGIILALGGKSSTTQRNPNTKGFIQTGKHVADMSVTLVNTGPEAYKAEEYGNRITISRKISDEGSSSYKIFSEGGKLISQKKEEINNILTALNVQIDNPVCILTQEASRSLLESKDPKKKYSFFLKATQLEQIYNNYQEAKENRYESKQTLMKKIEAKDELNDEVKKLEEQVKRLESLDEKAEKVKDLENEQAWAFAKAKEMEEKSFRDTRDKAKAAEDKAKKLLEDVEKSIKECSEKKEKLYDDQKNLKIEIGNINKQYTACNRQLEEHNVALKTVKIQIEKKSKFVDNEQKQIDILERNIQELKENFLRDTDEEKQKREKKIQELLQKNDILKSDLRQVEGNMEYFAAEKESCCQSKNLLQRKINELEQEKNSTQEILDQMESTLTNRHNLYGQQVPTLLLAIDEAVKKRHFRCKPIGPLGLYMQVRNKKWAFAIEKSLGYGLLQSFCCDNMNDRRVLIDIMKPIYKTAKMPSIIISQFLRNVHNVQKTVSEYQTIYDEISCENPVVMNCLIDQKSIENVILIEDSEEASNVMMDRPPRNCLSAFTINADQLYPYPNYRYYSSSGKHEIRYLRESFSPEDIRLKKMKIHDFNQQKTNLIAEMQTITQNIDKYFEELVKFKGKYRSLKQEYKINEENIKSFQISENPTDVTAQEEDLEKHKSVQKKVKEEVDTLLKELEEKEKQKMLYEINREKLKSTREEKENELNLLLGCIQTAEVRYASKSREREQKNKDLKVQSEKLQKAEKDFWVAENNTQEAVQKALQLCPRIETNKSPDLLEKEINELRNVIQDHVSLLNKDAIRKNYHEKKTCYDEMVKEIEKLKNCIKMLKKLISVRLVKYEKMRSMISIQVKILFNVHLNVRKYKGHLTFDHEKQTLDIEANPEDQGDLYKTNFLSGGERSYVTVSLLMALFEVAEMPFHILDEYDVFMDRSNKDASMNIFMEKAKEDNNRDQFIFITPLDLPSSIDLSMVKVHRMPDPEREAVRR